MDGWMDGWMDQSVNQSIESNEKATTGSAGLEKFDRQGNGEHTEPGCALLCCALLCFAVLCSE